MTDGHATDQDKLGKAADGTSVVETPPVVDPWSTAFASLEEPVAPVAEGDTGDATGDGTAGAGATPATPPTPDAANAPGDAPVGSGDAGGPVPPAVGAGDEDAAAPVDAEAAVATIVDTIKSRALEETAQMFVDRADDQGRKLIRQTNGRLGATINDPDIYQVDESTGAPTFYNPDTGRPFTGDNPRAQAKQWVDAYNEELRETFNRLAEEREVALETEMAPVIQLLKFTPTFEALDPTRQKMLEALIEDYEVLDAKGVHIGYSCDLNQALAQVNKQIASIQAARDADPAASAIPVVESTGPALDMPNSGSGVSGQRPEFKNLGEAMEWEQDQQLANARKK